MKKYMLIYKKRIRFNKVKKVSIVFYESNFIKLKNKLESVYVEKNEINFWIFLKSLCLALISFKFFRLSDIYFYQFFKKLNPDVLISNEVNGVIFRYKKFFPKNKTIMYQTVNWIDLWRPTMKKFYNIHNTDLKFETDYFCLIHKKYLPFYNFFKTKFIETGSIKNNSFELKISKPKFDVGFVSNYEKYGKDIKSYYGTNNNPSVLTTQDAGSSFIAKILKKIYKKNKKLKFVLIQRSNRSDKKINEKVELSFFKRDFQNFKIIKGNNYQTANLCKVVIVHDSSFAFDFIARKKKFLYLEPFYFLNKSLMNTLTTKKEGLFWYNGNDEKKIINKINYLIKLKEIEWLKKFKNTNINIPFDEKNTKLNNLIIKLTKKK